MVGFEPVRILLVFDSYQTCAVLLRANSSCKNVGILTKSALFWLTFVPYRVVLRQKCSFINLLVQVHVGYQ